MKKLLFSLGLMAVLGLFAAPVMSSEQCLQCHQDQKDNEIHGHTNCMGCHSTGADAHLENFKEHPAPVTNETCQTCHTPTDEWKAISAHGMDMECSACHAIHEDE